MKDVCILGLGYIGLPTASMAAKSGYHVTGVDVDPAIIEGLEAGRIHFMEPNLDVIVHQVIQDGSLRLQSEPSHADIFLIAVPTPINDDKSADLSSIISATRSIASVLQKDSLVIVESTVPPGTTEEIVLPILEGSGLKGGSKFYLAYCPERVLPGRIVEELMTNDRVIGGLNDESRKRAVEFYRRFVKGDTYVTDLKTAEMIKLVENAYRDVNIAFANEISLISHKLGIDVWNMLALANKHPRVNILNPGPGVGGHCIAVDPWFLINKVPDASKLMKTARNINDSMPSHVVSLVESAVCKGSKVACFGVTYKADVSDIRESPALNVIAQLEERGYEVYVVDPNVESLNGHKMVTMEEAVDVADCVVLLVDHAEFKLLNLERLCENFGKERLIDTRGAWNNY